MFAGGGPHDGRIVGAERGQPRWPDEEQIETEEADRDRGPCHDAHERLHIFFVARELVPGVTQRNVEEALLERDRFRQQSNRRRQQHEDEQDQREDREWRAQPSERAHGRLRPPEHAQIEHHDREVLEDEGQVIRVEDVDDEAFDTGVHEDEEHQVAAELAHRGVSLTSRRPTSRQRTSV